MKNLERLMFLGFCVLVSAMAVKGINHKDMKIAELKRDILIRDTMLQKYEERVGQDKVNLKRLAEAVLQCWGPLIDKNKVNKGVFKRGLMR